MRLLFDIWIKNSGIEFKYTLEEQIIFEEIYKYVSDRVYPILPEIEVEQDASEFAVIMVYLSEKPIKIQPEGFSDELFNKIMACFNENDAHLIEKKVAKASLHF